MSEFLLWRANGRSTGDQLVVVSCLFLRRFTASCLEVTPRELFNFSKEASHNREDIRTVLGKVDKAQDFRELVGRGELKVGLDVSGESV